MLIPRIIHQTYPTKNLPDSILQNIEFLQRNNPGWEYRFYDDVDIEQFIKKISSRSFIKLTFASIRRTVQPELISSKIF